MKSLTLISFTFVLIPVFLLTTNAFKCYRCGGGPNGTGNDPEYGDPCPQQFTDDPKYIVDCPVPTKPNGRYACTRFQVWHLNLHNNRADRAVEYRSCSEFVEKIKESDGNCGDRRHACQCNKESCDCFETLCNGVVLDELIARGERPYNPYSTTTTTSTTTETKRPEPVQYSKGQDTSKIGGFMKLLCLLFVMGQVVSFVI